MDFPPMKYLLVLAKNIHFHTPKLSDDQSPLSPFNKGQSAFSLFGSGEFKVNKNGQIPMDQAYDKAFSPPSPTEAEEPVRLVTQTDN